MGDFSATIADEGRFAEGRGFHFCSNEGLSKQVDGCFTNFTELNQSDPTHRTMKEDRIVGMGRIDRMYVNLPPHELQDRKIMGGHHSSCPRFELAFWPCAHLGIDCSPMQRVAHGEADVVIPRLAKWVVQHPNFQQYVEEQLVAAGGTTDDIYFDVKGPEGLHAHRCCQDQRQHPGAALLGSAAHYPQSPEIDS